MDKQTIDIIGNIFSVIFGTYSSVFCKALAKSAVEQQYKLLGIRFNEKGYEISFLIGGIALVIIGILSVLDIIKF